MKLSYNWLKEFVDLDVPAEEVEKALVSAGIEVASVTRRAIPSGVVAARIAAAAKHPNADKLTLCSVETGAAAPLPVVCGAPNSRANITVALATLGTQLAPDFVIKKAKLRGEESQGMLCSERELGISDDHSGIIELPDDMQPGTPLNSILPDDVIFELELTANRGDCLSVAGVAREMAAAFGRPLKRPVRRPQESGGSVGDHIAVTIEAADRCPRYMGRLVRGITIRPSPLWMKNRLTAAGMRPINNIVDVTNYILLAYGQPMHAFDYDRIGGGKIIVRCAAEELKYRTLDDTERDLRIGDLLICDAERPVALAGIMGGAGSEICDATSDVFLECAYFDPSGIRVTSKRLGLSTEASYRFERGVDGLDGLEDALDTAAELIRELAGGQIVSGVIDAFAKKFDKKIVSVRPARARLVLGADIADDAMAGSLAGLGMAVVERGADRITVEVPQFRHDVSKEIDLIEEIGRLYGYDRIAPAGHAVVSLGKVQAPREGKMALVRKTLAYAGFNELVTNSMFSEKEHALLTPAVEPVRLKNALNPQMALMRTTLLGSHLQALVYNLNHKNGDNRFFELGRSFTSRGADAFADERDIAAVLIEGSYIPQWWGGPAVAASFSTLKGIVEAFAFQAGLDPVTFGSAINGYPWFEQEFASITAFGGAVTGAMGRVEKRILAFYDIKTPVYWAMLDLTAFLDAVPHINPYQPLPRYPALYRDFAFVMPDAFEAQILTREIHALSDLVEQVRPFDVYRGEKLGTGLKSIAYAVTLRSREKTLTEAEAEAVCRAIVDTMKGKFGIELR